MALDIQHTFLERFLRYVQVDTQSDASSRTIPSTEKQKNLGRILVEELHEMGIEDAHLDEYGYIYATIPANTDKPNVPVICFCSHMDTAPDCSGKDVKPLIHRNYQGGDIVLPDDPTVVLSPKDHPNLREQIGNDIITASGTTLLGADNKAGLAEIMDAAHYLMTHPEVKHGKIRILFTPDEEIGRGVDKVDMEKLGADYGYTVDGEKLGSLEDETFSADAVTIDIRGVSIHPGFAKGKLESALKIAADIVAALPKDRLSPETTEGKQGFIHPVSISGGAELAKIEFIIRDFTDEMLESHENVLRDIMNRVLKNYPNSRAGFKVTEQYRNMKKVLDQHPQVVENAMEAMRRAGVKPLRSSIRGGTDGSRLSFMGLPCPNIFAGEQAFHSREEWASVQDMEKAVAVIVELARVWEEGGGIRLRASA
ncbi:MAG: peptidase T [Lewinellaceae bacterium]|nr:peptidase T [Lewinellaceae bacterium]